MSLEASKENEFFFRASFFFQHFFLIIAILYIIYVKIIYSNDIFLPSTPRACIKIGVKIYSILTQSFVYTAFTIYNDKMINNKILAYIFLTLIIMILRAAMHEHDRNIEEISRPSLVNVVVVPKVLNALLLLIVVGLVTAALFANLVFLVFLVVVFAIFVVFVIVIRVVLFVLNVLIIPFIMNLLVVAVMVIVVVVNRRGVRRPIEHYHQLTNITLLYSRLFFSVFFRFLFS
jgi:hypothetical protein